ncbi:MAG: nucleotidyltransferase substrate binding protein [Verrucomicrobiaceae bacterium]|nr:nucleotidyltransferase substrate binding protein [Verrucomicrobiaceae bacterium]
MNAPQDIRWKQRFQNFTKALVRLSDAVELATERELTDLEQQGLIQAFEFTHELAWNTLKDYLIYQGADPSIVGSRDATRLAFQNQLIGNSEAWMEMIKSRNQTSHTYNQETADEIVALIIASYYPEFEQLRVLLTGKL